MSHSTTILHRVIVPDSTVDQIRPHLEATHDHVWLSRECRCDRYTLRGVPARLIDILIGPLAGQERHRADRVTCCEVARKAGKYDGAVRTALALRPWQPNQRIYTDAEGQHQPVHSGGLLTVAPVAALSEHGAFVLALTWPGGSWAQHFPRLACSLEGYDLRAVVLWHHARYYRFIPYEDASVLADAFAANVGREGINTLAEANRLASRQLYRLARDLGWRKLTTDERQRWGFGGQWVRAEAVAQRRAELGLASGVGQYTDDAAHGCRMGVGEEDGYIQTSYGSVEEVQ